MDFAEGIPRPDLFEKALASAYPGRENLKNLIRKAFNYRVGIEDMTSSSSRDETIVGDVIAWAQKEGPDRQELLVRGAYVQQPGNSEMQDYIEEVDFDYCYLSALGFEADVFVSYADDADPVWIKKFVRSLRSKTVRLLESPVRVMTSQNGSDAAQKSALLVAVLTPDYADSAHCRQEREGYLLRSGNSPDKLFTALRAPDAARPPDIPRTRHYEFQDDDDYFSEVDNLSRDLKDTLLKEKRNTDPAGVPPELFVNADSGDTDMQKAAAVSVPFLPVRDLARTVYLAEGTPDLFQERKAVERYLKQAELTVLPETTNRFCSQQDFIAEMNAHLEQCALYVQLLGAECDATPDLASGYAGLQHEQAVASQKPRLLWRPPDLKPADIASEAYRKLVELADVRAEPLEDFKRAVTQKLKELSTPPPPPTPPRALPWVFVDYALEDHDHVEQVVRTRLNAHHFDVSFPYHAAKSPSESRSYLQSQLEQCDVLLVVYGNSPLTWVTEQLRLSRRFRAANAQNFVAKALYDAPPRDKPEKLPFEVPDLQMLACRSSAEPLDAFLDELVRRSADAGDES